MQTVKTIRLFYVLYTAYTLFVMLISDYKPIYAYTGLVLMWNAYGLFELGYRSKRNTAAANESTENKPMYYRFPFASIQSWSPIKKMITTAFAWLCTILCARFYTGRSFSSVISGMFGGASAYMNYQRYFASSNLGTFSLSKIPYILMLAFLTVSMIWMVLSTILCKKENKWWDYFFLIGIVMAYLFFGSARGTNFETYIVFVVFSFCFLQKANELEKRKKIYILIVILLGILMVSIYRFVLHDRGTEFNNIICPEIQHDPSKLISRIFPNFVNIATSLFSYLGYGIYVIGVTLKDVCFASSSNIVGSVFPGGVKIITGSSIQSTLGQTINLGARWIPDYVLLINLLGIPLCFVSFIVLGRFAATINFRSYPQLLKEVLHTLVFIEMLSLPVGNFLLSSSSNELMVLFAMAWLIQDRYFVAKVKRSPSLRIGN